MKKYVKSAVKSAPSKPMRRRYRRLLSIGVSALLSVSTFLTVIPQTQTNVYAAGTAGAVYNIFGADNFTASANAFIAGGTLRNVYGGGWKGDVGYHDETTNDTTNDILGETHVVIGIRRDQPTIPSDYGFYNGVPAMVVREVPSMVRPT